MKIIIVDPETYRPYSLENLSGGGLGGTEATVIRLAEAMDALVLQHNRVEDNGRYRKMDSPEAPSHIIVVRDTLQAIRQAEFHPNARTFLWLHDMAGPDTPRGKLLRELGPKLAQLGITIVCVSDFLAAEVRGNFLSLESRHRPTVIRIYNPVVIGDADNANTAYDPNKLVFFSSRQKGLDYALYVFSYLHARNPVLRLYLANPGYYPDAEGEIPGVINLGSLPHARIIEHVRSSLCTFYPNYTAPETFGLVMAESNAVGTPVLAHAIGAAAEVLRGSNQIMAVPQLRLVTDRVVGRFPSLQRTADAFVKSAGALKCYENRINEWRAGARPAVFSRKEFSLKAVLSDWQAAMSVIGDTGN